MKLSSFLKECSEKGVLKKLSIYIVSSWVLIQVLAVLYQPLGLPQVSVTYLILLLLVGLPVNLLIIWRTVLAPLEKQQLTPKGKKKKKPSAFQRMYFSSALLVSLLSAVAFGLIVKSAFKRSADLRELSASDKIGILKFGNNTGEEDMDIVGKMSADWIMHGITENKLAQVVSPEIVNDYIDILKSTDQAMDNESVLKDYFKPAKVISGNYFLKGDKLIFQSSITDGNIEKTLISFQPVECDKASPLDCIETLKQRVLGYLITAEREDLNLQDFPPKYNAYRYFLEAMANYSDSERYIELLNMAVEEDPNYFEPKVERIAYYYNYGDYQKADSLFKALQTNVRINNRQRNLIEYYSALLQGNNELVFNHFTDEYNLAPFHMSTNSTTMVLALQYINRPQAIDTIYNRISMRNMNTAECIFCQYRYYVKALADIELEKYQVVIDSFAPITQDIPTYTLHRPLVAAYVRSGQTEALNDYLEQVKIEGGASNQQRLLFHTAKEYLIGGQDSLAKVYFGQVLSIGEADTDRLLKFKAWYYLGDHEKIQDTQLREDEMEFTELLSMKAVAAKQSGSDVEAEQYLEKIRNSIDRFDFGEAEYMLARYYEATGDDESALVQLRRSISKGYNYTPSTFQNDPQFVKFKTNPRFQEILTYWH